MGYRQSRGVIFCPVRTGQLRTGPVGNTLARIRQIGIGQVRTGQVGPGQVGPVKLGQVKSGQIKSCNGQLDQYQVKIFSVNQ